MNEITPLYASKKGCQGDFEIEAHFFGEETIPDLQEDGFAGLIEFF
jgi:hypothetical protein